MLEIKAHRALANIESATWVRTFFNKKEGVRYCLWLASDKNQLKDIIHVGFRPHLNGHYIPPIILLKKELGTVKSNQVVEILADDSSFENDLSAWCSLTDNQVLSVTRNEENIFTAYVEKH